MTTAVTSCRCEKTSNCVQSVEQVKQTAAIMASCLVPDFPAVMVTLEHLKELDKQLREDRAPFSPEASLHLTEMTAAITELEADRRTTYEHLEVETIKNSKLRAQMNNIRERISQEIVADVEAARASNAAHIKQLHNDLNTVSQLQESTLKSQEALLSQNEMLYPEQQQLKTEHESVIATLNDQITLKYVLQNQLDQTHEQIEELRRNIASVNQDKITLQQSMIKEREAFKAQSDNLSREEEQAEEKIKHQKQAMRKFRKELDRVSDNKLVSNTRLGELTSKMDMMGSKIQRLAESRCYCEKQLKEETKKHQALSHQREVLKKQMCELKETLSTAVKCLKEEICMVEDETEKSRASKLLHQGTLAQICETFKRQSEEENEVRAEHSLVTQKLDQSRQQLKECIASIHKHNKEINEMDKQIQELMEEDSNNKHIFERNQEEIGGNVDTEKKNISHLQEEKKRLTMLLEEAQKLQEEHMRKMTSHIKSVRRRYEELKQEEATLQQCQPKSADANFLLSYMDQCEEEYRQKESKCQQDIENCTAEIEIIMRSNKEKQREVEEKEEILREVEAKWNEEHSRHQRLEELKSELRRRKTELELSIERLEVKTSSALQAKEELKAELEEVRANRMATLNKQASQLRAVETSIYDSRVKLEQVNMENSRLHLCVRQMTEGISRARQDKDRYWQEVHQFKQDIAALMENLEGAWRDDLHLAQQCQSRDGHLLTLMTAMLDNIKSRKQQLLQVNTLLHQEMLDFSICLGDKATEEQ